MLINPLAGRWMVQTDTSAYVLDIDEMTCLRHPGMGVLRSRHPSMVTDLRRDGIAIPLLGIECLELDEPMMLWLDIRQDGVPTLRTTTSVRSCQQVTTGERV